MNNYWRVMVPTKPVRSVLRCVHGERKGQCIKNSSCPLHRAEPLLWKWMALFRYKRDAKRYAKCLSGAQIVEDEVV